MSAFDPTDFLDAAVDTTDEKRALLPTENPEHDRGYYTAIIGEISSVKGGVSQKSGKNWARIDIPLRIQVPASLQNDLQLNAELTITDGVMLDLDENGNMDNRPGRNNRRRMYREATGLNVAGEPFKFSQLTGQIVAVKLKHDFYNDEAREQVAAVFKA